MTPPPSRPRRTAAPAPSARAAAKPAAATQAARVPAKTQVGYYQQIDDVARARAAFDWTRPHTGYRSFSDLIAAAVMTEVHRLEAEYNKGKPWPAVEAGTLPVGRPLS